MESHLLGPRAVQPAVPSDHRGRVRGLLPGAVGGAGERRRIQHRAAHQHRAAQLYPMTIIGVPRPSPVPRVHSPLQPDADVQPLDRLHNGQEEVEGKA